MFRGKNKPAVEFVEALYARTAERSRAAELYERFGIPDTLDGRFDSLALHAWMMIDRLRLEPDGDALAQGFFNAMFRHLDLTLREIGVQDLGVGRRIKIMAEGFHGRALAYRGALAGKGELSLAEVLKRNAYGGRPPEMHGQVDLLAVYVARQAEQLQSTPRQGLAAYRDEGYDASTCKYDKI